MALNLAKVGELIEVTKDGDSPKIYHREMFQFNLIGTTQIKTIVLAGDNSFIDKRAITTISVSGTLCTNYADFKTKIAAIFA